MLRNSHHRWLAISVVVALVTIVPSRTLAQSGDGATAPPRTSWGDPDLQGVWTNDTITPFERPSRLADQEFFTEQEIAETQQRARDRLADATRSTAPTTEPLPVSRSSGSYSPLWYGPLDRMVTSRRTSLVIDPPDGRIPLRPEAEARRDYLVSHRTDGHENMSVYSRCLTRGVPGTMFPNVYNNGHQILQTPEFVVIHHEMMRHARIIPLTDQPHPDSRIRTWMGDARGHWDGDTLVVETTNFDDRGWISSNASAGRMHGVPVSEELTVVERFTRVDDTTIDWTVTVTDPQVYVRPWTVALPMIREPDYEIYEYACHEGNHAIDGILGGKRVEEGRQP